MKRGGGHYSTVRTSADVRRVIAQELVRGMDELTAIRDALVNGERAGLAASEDDTNCRRPGSQGEGLFVGTLTHCPNQRNVSRFFCAN